MLGGVVGFKLFFIVPIYVVVSSIVIDLKNIEFDDIFTCLPLLKSLSLTIDSF